eukprot:766672-Hanusia_phi.AAC.1
MAKAGDSAGLVALLKEVQVDVRDATGWTALHWAASRGKEEAARLLLEHKADPNASNQLLWAPVHDAARSGNHAILRLLKEAGADLLAKTDGDCTALHFAAKYDRVEAIKLLLEEERVNVNERNKAGQTALFMASSHGNEAAVRALVEKGASVLIGDKASRQPEDIARKKQLLAVLAVLEEAGSRERIDKLQEAETCMKHAVGLEGAGRTDEAAESYQAARAQETGGGRAGQLRPRFSSSHLADARAFFPGDLHFTVTRRRGGKKRGSAQGEGSDGASDVREGVREEKRGAYLVPSVAEDSLDLEAPGESQAGQVGAAAAAHSWEEEEAAARRHHPC